MLSGRDGGRDVGRIEIDRRRASDIASLVAHNQDIRSEGPDRDQQGESGRDQFSPVPPHSAVVLKASFRGEVAASGAWFGRRRI